MVKQLIAVLFLICSYTFSQPADSLTSGSQNTAVDSIITPIPNILPSQDSLSTTLITELPDTISPLQGEPLTSTSTIIERQTFLFTNYRYAGDLLRSFPLNFIKDQGFIGQPNESFIYGIGNNGVNYLKDGILWNNRYTNSLDLNHIQSEDIDSIEIVPSPRGFLYGPYNNPVTVNFISRDFASPEPYSRIKYYEGPSGEAMIDGLFNANIFKRWNFGLQVTNRKFDSTYTNSAFSIWQINTKLKYFLSNSVNISAYYGYVDSKVGLNDGVDVDSISNITSDINSILYEPLRAPVVSPNQKLETLQHNFVLRTLAKPFDNSKLDLSFYYRYNLDELRDFRDSTNFKSNIENRTYGGVLNYYYTYDFLTLKLFGDYEKSDFDFNSTNGVSNSRDELYNLGGLITLSTLDKNLRFSLFYKDGYIEKTDFSYSGMGADLKYILRDEFSFYAGYSLRQVYGGIGNDVPTIEGGINYHNFNFVLDVKYFNNEYIDILRLTGEPKYYGDHLFSNEGVGLIINYKFWILLLESNTSYYFKIEDDNLQEAGYEKPKSLPDWQFIGGLYVSDLFFDNNLDLKAGFKFSYTGKINTSQYYWGNDLTVEPTNKLDFTLAGEIKKLAIFYFIWENLFDKQYYITP
ncbi:MAG TPA: TonB-dependent receptor plug domain-containing protein, partial [Ignavibacteriaceae bacterium]|nr:TonB-dependent receptor plug domain-containing protein [Ignavibacteriaceae bacterium]